MDRLEQINNSINEIRDILDAECTPISELPTMVRSLAEISAKSGYTTAFLFSSKNKPATPTSGDLNISTGLIEDIDVDWSQTVETSPSSIHMSFAIFNPTGEKVKDWSAPISLKGPKGDPGATGPAGATGAKGEKGETGVSVSFRTVSVYTTTDTTDSPYKPVGGKWIFTTNEVEVPGGESEWFLNANEPPKKKFLWLSQATFGEDGNLVNDWCLPFRLTGEDGKDGVDGTLTEFIYRRLKDFTTYEALVKYLEDNELQSKNEQDFIPEDSFDAPDWTDRPMGIDGEFYKIEVCCTRKRKGVDEAWGDWSDCVIWSKWGEDGMDGDGIEYIYLVTPSTFNGEKITPEIVSKYFTPDRDAVLLEDEYQESEFCFNKDFGYDGYDWTDEPSDVGPDQPIEWVMVRKQKDGVWQKFSDPSIWATFAEDGAAYITSLIFARSISEPDVPTGGSFDFPSKVDQSDVWFDTVPGGDLNIPVWMSTRTFKSGDNDWDSTWSKPKQMVDTNDFQVEYSSYVNPNNPNNPPQITDFTGDEDEWRKSNPNWSDYIDDAVWMATCRCSGGVWEKWVVTRIKGEKGDKGEAGSSVAIEGQFETKEELLAAWTKYVTSGDVSGFYFESADKTIDQGDGWYVTTEGKLYSYSGGWSEGESDTDFDKYWFSTTIKGEPGDTFYAYTAYSDSYPVTEISLHPGKPMAYIGLWYSNKVWKDDAPERKDPNNYEWTKWSGEDGWGYEQIFLLTHKNLPYNPNGKECPLPLREVGDNVPEYLPKHPFGWGAKPFTEASNYESEKNRWSDTPLSPTEEYPYCWVAYRKTNGKEFGDWKGNRNGDIETASLYSRYTVDGVSGVYLEFSNDFAYIPTENDHVDPDFIAGIADGTIDPIQTIVRAYIGDEPANSLQLQIDGEHITVEGDVVTLNVDEITPDITEIPLKITVGDTVYNKSWKLFYSSVGYSLYPDTLVLKRDSLTGKLIDTTLSVTIKKWDGKKFVETGIPLFAKVSFDSGSDDLILSTGDGEITPTTGGIATIDLTKIHAYPTNIHLYVVEQDEDGNYVSTNPELPTPQDIGIIFDGKNTYTINLTNDLGIVPLEEDGTIDAQAEKIETKIEMYEGNEVATGVKYSIDKEYTGVTLNANLVTIIPSSFKSAEDVPTEIVCYAEKDNIKLSKTFKLLTTKNAYELFVDKNVLTKNPYNGKLNESVIECTLKRWDSINNQYKLPDNISDLYVHVECEYTDASEQTSVVNSKFNESGITTLNLKDEKGLVAFRLYVSSESTLTEAKNNWLTYEDVGVIADGQSVYHLELTNEFTMIATDDAGNPNTDWDEDDSDENQDLAYSEAQMYLGAEEIEATYLWEITTGSGKLENASSAKCSLIEMTTDAVTIRCTATYNGISQSKDFNVVKSKGQPVYQIVPSASLFVYAKDNGPLIGPHEIQCTINKWTGSRYEQITDLDAEGLELIDADDRTLNDGILSPKKDVQTIYLKKDGLIMDQETIGFVEGGSKGTAALHLELSNEFTMIPTNSDGEISESWDEDEGGEQDLAISSASLFLGTEKITPKSWTWEIVEENGGTLKGNDTDTCSVLTMNLDAITVRCTAVYSGESISKEFRVVKSKGNPVYRLLPSASLFRYGKDGSNEASPEKITFVVNKWDGVSFKEIACTDDSLSLVDNNGNAITELLAAKREQIVLLKHNGIVVDKETIGFVEGGSRGTDGTSPLHIELTNDFTMVATDSEGNLISGWDEDLSDSGDHDFAVTEAQIFYGINNVTNDCTINWDIYPSDGGVRQVGETGAKFSLVEMSADALTIRCIANYGKVTVTKDFNVVKSKGQDVYKIVPSHTAFVGDKLGNVTPDSITINVSKWTNGTYSIVNAAEEGLTLSHSTLTPTQGNQTVTLKKGGVLLDTETIGYIESGKDGLNAVALFKSTVFIRSNDDLSNITLSGGSYNDPKPNNSNWQESIPDGDAQLWAATRTFSSDDKWVENWSKPVKMTDTSSFEAVFGIKTASRVDLPVDDNGLANPGNYTNGWDDEPKDGTEYWFMATATSKNGVWSKWTVSQIKGENGKNGHSIVMHETKPTNPEMGDGYVNDVGELLIWDGDSWVNCGVIKGKDGKDGEAGSAGKGIISTEVVYAITDNQEITPSDWYSTTPILEQGKYLWTKTTWKYTDGEEEIGYQKTYIPTDGSDGQDGEAGKAGVGIASTKVEYVISDSGTITPEIGWDEKTPILENGKYLWTRTTWTYTDNTNESGYSVTYIGQDGKNNFIHVKYASEVTIHSDGTVSGKFTEPDGEVPGKYMGVCVDENVDDPTDFNAYKWTKAEGEDGFGYEYIYQRTNTNEAPDIPTEKTADDVAPDDWTDSPTGVDENNMYEWVCWRKKVNGEWTDWQGANNSAKAALWAKWGETGQTGDSGEDAVYLELSNEAEMVPCDGEGKVAATWSTQTTMTLYKGSAPVTKDVTYKVNGKTVTSNIVAINKDYITGLSSKVKCEALYNGITYTKEMTLTKSVGVTAYKLVPSATAIRRDKNGKFTPTSVTATAMGWSNGKWVTSTQGIVEYSSNDSSWSPNTVSPSDTISNIYIRLLANDGTTVLDKETIPIIWDGTDGQPGGQGDPGVSKFKSTVFVRTNGTPSTPSGGSFSDPTPDDDSWKDGIPSGDAKLWASSRTFSSDGNHDANWSDPAVMASTSKFTVKYTKSDVTDPGTPDAPASGVSWVDTSSTGAIWMATRVTEDGVAGSWSVSKIKGETGATGGSGAPGVSPTITKKYALSKTTAQPNVFDSDIPLPTTPTNKYCWCRETITQGPNSTSKTQIYVVSIHGETGPAGVGSTGAQGPIVYPAGAWREDIDYSHTVDTNGNITATPYVFWEGADTKANAYYKLLTNVTGSSNPTPNNDSQHWQKIEYFDSIFADVGFFNQATVGQFVFHQDYVFSQEGVNANGENVTYNNYIDYESESQRGPAGAIFNGIFKPNILFNAVTGAGNLNTITVSKVDTKPNEDSAKITIQDDQLTVVGENKVVYVGNSQYDDNVFTFTPINVNKRDTTTKDFNGRSTLFTSTSSTIKMSAPRLMNITLIGDIELWPGGNAIPDLKIYAKLYKDNVVYKQYTFVANQQSGATISGGGKVAYNLIDTFEIPEGQFESMSFEVSLGKDNMGAHVILQGYSFDLKVSQQHQGNIITALGLDGLRLINSEKIMSIGRDKTHLQYGNASLTMDNTGILLRFGEKFGLRLTSNGVQVQTNGRSWEDL